MQRHEYKNDKSSSTMMEFSIKKIRAATNTCIQAIGADVTSTAAICSLLSSGSGERGLLCGKKIIFEQ
jgi:hypothetical protein